jgi:hypothetical protein
MPKRALVRSARQRSWWIRVVAIMTMVGGEAAPALVPLFVRENALSRALAGCQLNRNSVRQ